MGHITVNTTEPPTRWLLDLVDRSKPIYSDLVTAHCQNLRTETRVPLTGWICKSFPTNLPRSGLDEAALINHFQEGLADEILDELTRHAGISSTVSYNS